MHQKAERIKKMKVLPVDPALQDRVPPGQVLTERFPILHEGEVPSYEMEKWSLRVFGEVVEEKSFSFDNVLKLPQTEITCDIHCVTRWSKLDTTWKGVLFRDLLDVLELKTEAKYVMFHGANQYEANVPLRELLKDDILLAYQYNGENLTPKHGWPLRVVIPHLYFWKSTKWLEGIQFMAEDRHGFWEQNGFHNEADPFQEERFSGDELPIPEDEWHRKEFD